MREWNQILGLMKSYSLREFSDYCRYTHEGRYRLEHRQHDTASHVRIYALAGAEELLVYRRDQWIDAGYEFNNNGTTQGYQHEGPWVEELEDMRREMDAEIDAHLEKVRLAELRKVSDADQAEADKVVRFAEIFAD